MMTTSRGPTPETWLQLAPVGSRRVKDPISVDEVLDMHRLLERFQGGTVELLALLEDGPRE